MNTSACGEEIERTKGWGKTCRVKCRELAFKCGILACSSKPKQGRPKQGRPCMKYTWRCMNVARYVASRPYGNGSW